VVPKLEKRDEIMNLIHEEIRHFNEQRNLVEVKKNFWHNIIKSFRKLIRKCKWCEMVKKSRSMRLRIVEMKNTSICDLFYQVALKTSSPIT